MSRSYKKPYVTEGYGGTGRRVSKRCANRSVRVSQNICNGSFYKKLFCSWSIVDFKFKIPKPKESGRIIYGRYESYEEMKKNYRKATRK